MTIHYHGTPITPLSKLEELRGRHFCVSFIRPDNLARVQSFAQSIMLDNGAFSVWRSGKTVNWSDYYAWADKHLDAATTWAVIPDVITGTDEDQDALIAQWPHGRKGAPVWHMHESIARLLRLIDQWPRICMGSSAEYSRVLSPDWCRRMDEAWSEISKRHKRTPDIHMLRGMATSGKRWPFASVDSTDIARNHNRPQNTPRSMADRWDAMQCRPTFVPSTQEEPAI